MRQHLGDQMQHKLRQSIYLHNYRNRQNCHHFVLLLHRYMQKFSTSTRRIRKITTNDPNFRNHTHGDATKHNHERLLLQRAANQRSTTKIHRHCPTHLPTRKRNIPVYFHEPRKM
uniref:RF3 n=1 Tax=Human betaherpesvirus 6A TaxID=32603 RepID=Q86574_9BETA|nr:RF3 [Human betaherpesvirus 6A]